MKIVGTIQLKGDDLMFLAEECRGPIRKAVADGVAAIAKLASEKTTRLTGSTAASFESEIEDFGKDTLRGMAYAANKKGGSGMVARFREFGTAKEPAHPVLLPAFNELEESIMQDIESALAGEM
jgi:HK97 gp10 family phage protein